ncbi:MAG: Spy/CpxP family protein refolding chaperone [Longimicrobiales bacterium]
MNRKALLAVAAAAALGSVGLLYAQERAERAPAEPGTEMMGMMHGCPMMAAHMHGAERTLRQREELDLSAEQVAALERVREDSKASRAEAMRSMREAHGAAAAAAESEILDEAAARTAFRRMADVHADMAVSMLRERGRVREILSEEQETELRELNQGMMSGMMGMMRMMGMMMGGDSAGGMQRMGGMEGMQGMHEMMEMMRECPMMRGMSRDTAASASSAN